MKMIEGSDLKQEVGAPQATVQPHPAGAAVVQTLLQPLKGTPAWPPLHLNHHVLRTAPAHIVWHVKASYGKQAQNKI